MSYVALILGVALWAGATALLTEDAIRSGHLTITHALQPLLTAGTVAAAVWVHKARWLAKPAFLLLALIGSVATLYGTMGRLADAQDDKAATIGAANRTYGEKAADLKAAKTEAARECKSIGPKCERWNARVDQLTRELSAIVVRSTDARAEAIGRLVTLVGGNGEKVRAIVTAFDPIVLPIFLEMGSILFFAVAFGKRQHLPPLSTASVEKPSMRVYTRSDALADFRKLRETGAQKVLAARWQVSEGTVSKWLSSWESEKLVARNRVGRERPVLALPAPSR